MSNKGTLAVHLIVSTTEVLEFVSQPKERESVENQSFKEQYPFGEKGKLEYKKYGYKKIEFVISQAFQKLVMIQLTSPNKTLSLGFQGQVEPKRDNHQGHTPKMSRIICLRPARN